jgi:hypothetical protein
MLAKKNEDDGDDAFLALCRPCIQMTPVIYQQCRAMQLAPRRAAPSLETMK